MKKRKIMKQRVLSLLLVFVMCLGMVDTAFAEGGDDLGTGTPPATTEGSGEGDVTPTEPVTPGGTEGGGEGDSSDTPEAVEPTPISPSDAPVPSDDKLTPDENGSKTESDVNETNPDTGAVTTGTTTDKKWDYISEDTKGEYGDKQTVENPLDEDGKPIETDNPDAVDRLTDSEMNPDDIDIEDGTYTKTENQTKQDIKVEKEGEDHTTDTKTTETDGFVSGTDHDRNGKETTTTTITDSTKTTTTEVEKKTEVTETNPGLENGTEDPESKTKVPDSEKTETIKGEVSDPTDIDGKKVTSDQTVETENQGGQVTVTMTPGEEKTVVDTAERTPTLPNLNKIFEHCNGWTIKDENGNAVGTMDATGTVTAADGTTYQAGFVQNGTTWTFTLNAEKKQTPDLEKTGSTSIDESGDLKVGIDGEKETIRPGKINY